MTCHGVARQGEDGRPHLVRHVRLVRQVRLKRHAPADGIPPLPSSCQHTPAVIFRPRQTTLRQSKPTGYHMTCHGVARQGEDERPHLVRHVRRKRHAPLTAYPRSHQEQHILPRKPPVSDQINSFLPEKRSEKFDF